MLRFEIVAIPKRVFIGEGRLLGGDERTLLDGGFPIGEETVEEKGILAGISRPLPG